MITDKIAKQLHDRATRGESLTPEERTQLENWYMLQDQNESEQLGLSKPDTPNANLQTQIKNALSQLDGITKRIREVTSENEVLRREITSLRRQLTHQITPQLA